HRERDQPRLRRSAEHRELRHDLPRLESVVAIRRSISRSSSRVSDSSSTRLSTSESAWPSNTSRTNSRSRSRRTDSRRNAALYTYGSRVLSTTTAFLAASRPSSVITVVYASDWPRLPREARTSATDAPRPSAHSAFITRSSAGVMSGQRAIVTTTFVALLHA